jgi:hypothetical protein
MLLDFSHPVLHLLKALGVVDGVEEKYCGYAFVE